MRFVFDVGGVFERVAAAEVVGRVEGLDLVALDSALRGLSGPFHVPPGVFGGRVCGCVGGEVAFDGSASLIEQVFGGYSGRILACVHVESDVAQEDRDDVAVDQSVYASNGGD